MNAPAASAIPVLRVFDEALAREFYCDFLGFQIAWERRSDEGLPWYAEVRGYGVRLHLSGHHGDASPGGAVIVEVDDAAAVHRRLTEARRPYARPGLEREDWGLTVTVIDPFHNRVTFLQPTGRPVPQEPEAADAGAAEAAGQGVSGPIEHEVVVATDPEHAFAAFTARLGEWWDPRLTPCPDSFAGASVGTRPGEPVVLHHEGDGDFPIGVVTDYQPGRRYAQQLSLGLDPEHPTTVAVTFRPDEDGTLVHLAHGGWTSHNAGHRGKFTEWPQLLARFAALAQGRDARR